MADQRKSLTALFSTAVLFFGALLANQWVNIGISLRFPSLPASVITVLGSLAGVIACALLAKLLRPKHGIKINFGRWQLDHPWGWGMAVLFAMQSMGWIAEFTGSFFGFSPASPEAAEPWPLTLLFRVLTIPILEELFYRGFLLEIAFSDESSPNRWKFPVILQGLLFALLHRSPIAMAYAAVGGILLGYFTVKTGSLRFSVLIHIVNNFIAFMQTQIALFFGLPSARLFCGLIWLAEGTGILWLVWQWHKRGGKP